ncbi:MAG: hypothetical protein ACYC3X_24325 [Pirellulaceae bacterium]
MASPLHVFRKYQYVFLVGFGIMLMFAFVIAPPLSDYLQSRAGTSGGGNPVVVTWTSGELREGELANLRTQHLLTTRFLETLVRRVQVKEDVAVKLRGEPVTLIKGRSYPWVGRGMNADNTSAYQIALDGEVVEVPQTAVSAVVPKVQLISQATSEEELVQRLMLAEKAREAGVVISEGAILDYLDNLCDASATSRPNYATLLREATGGRLDMKRFYSQMATELAAQRMLIMSQGGLYAAPPELLYECYNRLNRRVTAELLAVDVAGFIGGGNIPEPTDQEITALYEKGKDRFPFPLSPDPGFKRRQQIAFGYFKGVFDEFLQREMDVIRPTITSAQIEKYYEDNKATEFKMPELPADPPAATVPATGQEPAAGATSPENPPSTPPAATPEAGPVAPPQTPPAGQEPAPAPPVEPAANPQSPAPAMPENAPPAAPEQPSNDQPVPPPSAESKPDAPGAGGVSLSLSSPLPLESTLVSYQSADPPPQPTDAPAQQPAMPDAGGSPPPAADPASPQSEPAPPAPAPASETPPQAEPAAPAPETPPVTPQPGASAGPAMPADGATAPSTSPGAADAGATQEAAKPAEKPVRIKPLDDALRAEIRDTLARLEARQPAQEKLEKAADEVRTLVERYAQQLSRSKLLTESAKPAVLDFSAIAKEHNLVYEKTPPWDVLDISQIQQADPADGDPPYYELARANETLFGQQTGMVRRSLIDVGFAGDLAPFVPRRLVDGILAQGGFPIPPEKLFVYWRDEVVPEEVPLLDAIRDEVVRAWKMQKALPLARAKTEQMAQQAADAAKPLAEVFADNATKVIKTNPFSWMTLGSVPGSSSGQPTLSQVNGKAADQSVTIAGAGGDFMQAVFDLSVGQVGVSVNEPETFVYVVRLDSEEPSDEQRRESFFTAGLTPEVNYLVQTQQADIIREWYTGLETDYHVTWKRAPIRNWNVE